LRDDLHGIELADGSWLSIRGGVESLERRQPCKLWVDRHPPGTFYEKGPVMWTAAVATMEYKPDAQPYYALLKIMGDRVFVFLLSDSQYFVIDTEKGRILAKDRGDDPLRRYGALIPLKLSIHPPATGETRSKVDG
jgi:hypothetical protein